MSTKSDLTLAQEITEMFIVNISMKNWTRVIRDLQIESASGYITVSKIYAVPGAQNYGPILYSLPPVVMLQQACEDAMMLDSRVLWHDYIERRWRNYAAERGTAVNSFEEFRKTKLTYESTKDVNNGFDYFTAVATFTGDTLDEIIEEPSHKGWAMYAPFPDRFVFYAISLPEQDKKNFTIMIECDEYDFGERIYEAEFFLYVWAMNSNVVWTKRIAANEISSN